MYLTCTPIFITIFKEIIGNCNVVFFNKKGEIVASLTRLPMEPCLEKNSNVTVKKFVEH